MGWLSDLFGNVDSEKSFREDSPNHGMFVLPDDKEKGGPGTTIHVYSRSQSSDVDRIYVHPHPSDGSDVPGQVVYERSDDQAE
jgi:hypothetical protein